MKPVKVRMATSMAVFLSIVIGALGLACCSLIIMSIASGEFLPENISVAIGGLFIVALGIALLRRQLVLDGDGVTAIPFFGPKKRVYYQEIERVSTAGAYVIYTRDGKKFFTFNDNMNNAREARLLMEQMGVRIGGN